MHWYPLVRPLLFCLEPERAHHLALDGLDLLHRLRGARPAPRVLPRVVMGLEFPNPVGLAAGLDKDGAHIDALAGLGFGFLEVGTVTPRPQPGNPRPRLFRLPEAQALINRMGFNNQGVDALLTRLARTCYRGILGINLGKNFDTPIENAVDDYRIGLRKVYAHAGYVTVNISSPNTLNLRQLQQVDALRRLLEALQREQTALALEHGRRVPLVVKIAPDLEEGEIVAMARLLLESGVEGVIATNTTVSRAGVEHLPHAGEAGGLSGAPLGERSTRVVALLAAELGGRLPIIAAGGILSGEDALAKLRAGASLVQLYTGLIYRGPGLVGEVLDAFGAEGA